MTVSVHKLEEYMQGLKELETISKGVGERIDYVQGGGGNTSVKLSDELMAVKASGFKLKQINPTEGYVVVNYRNIKNYYENVDISQDVDFEKESVELAKSNVVEMDGLKVLRPSVEAGFHSIMKKYVIHTHPVYANILCCCAEGRQKVDAIFKGKDYECLWIPYINPGFCLTLKIGEEIERCIKEKGKFPEVIFMENHGLIVTADDYPRALELHEEVNRLIRNDLRLEQTYPELELIELGENEYVSNTVYLQKFFVPKCLERDFFDRISLYPDQLVYLNSSLSTDGSQNKLNLDTKTGELLYHTNFSEAQTIEETLLGYIYVVDNIERCGLTIKTMSERDIDFIRNWESEAYRKSLVKDLVK